MRFQSLSSVIALAVAMTLQAQQQQPKPKSQKEVDALQKVQAAAQAQNYDAELQAINNVLENFADTEYKPMLLSMAVDAAQRKGDQAQVTVYGERAIQANPNDILTRVILADNIVRNTRENDLDKEQSLKKADDYANKALDLLKTSNTPQTGVPADQWPEYKKDLTMRAYNDLGQSANLRKNYPEAIKDFKSALDAQPANSIVMAHLLEAYMGAKQYDDVISTADKISGIADAPDQVKQFAQKQKDAATKLKAAPAAK